jgi:hypothetical protein
MGRSRDSGTEELEFWVVARRWDDVAVRHLTPSFACGALRRGKQIEQFIGPVTNAGRVGCRFLTVIGSGPFEVRVHDVEDIGDETFLDVSEFPPLDPSEHVGEGRTFGTYESPDQAVAVALKLGGHPDKWVNFGVLGDEYRDLWLRARAEPPAS